MNEQIRAFINKFNRNQIIGDQDDIFENGYVNSLFAMQLVLFLETEFSVSFEHEELAIDNFRTIHKIETILKKKLEEANSHQFG